MLIKSTKPEDRARFTRWMGICAQIALVLGILLNRLDSPYPAVNFIAGMLLGFSMVGNLAFLVTFSRRRSSK